MAFETTDELRRLEADARYLAFLVQAGELLAQSLDYRETLNNVCTAAVSTVADPCIIDLGDSGETLMVAAAHRDPNRTKLMLTAGRHLESAAGRPRHPVCEVIDSGRPLIVPKVDDAWIDANATGHEHARYLRDMEYESLIVVPIVSMLYGVTGALTLATTKGGRPPLEGEEALMFATDLGRRCGAAIGKARVYSEAVAVAERFQRAALPRTLPSLPRLQVDAVYEPARSSMLVGGDWYDVFPLRDGRIGISIGDVSGHGLDAAVMMSAIKNALQTALIVEPDLAAALDACDFALRNENRLHGEQESRYCTALLSILDPAAMTLECMPAGHPGPNLWRPSTGEVTDPFDDRGLPLGCRDLSTRNAKARKITLEQDAFVVFYTDGLVESERNLLDGERRLHETILREDIRQSREPAAAIRRAVVTERAEDDIAILTIRVRS